MKSYLSFFLLSALLLGSPLLGQQAPNNAIGFQPAKSFQMGDYDTVNLFNGNLTMALPIGPTYTPGGNLAYGLHLIYNGNTWAMQGDVTPEAVPNRFCNAGLGWKLTLGDLVAPNDPNALQISAGGNWVYVGADGSEHTFYLTLHDEENGTQYAGSDSLVPGTVVAYTRDGSYLRLRRETRDPINPIPYPCTMQLGFCIDYNIFYSIEAPDGNVHTFEAQLTKNSNEVPPTVLEDSKLTYRLVSIVDRFGNYLHITYPDALTWILKDGTPAGDVRTHTVHLINQTFYDYNGQPNAHLFVDHIDLAAFNSQTATYTFHYGSYESISKNCDDKYTGETANTRFLDSITQPDGSTFSMNYNKIEIDPATNLPTCSLKAGHLLKLTFPTGGSVQYTLQTRVFPKFPDELSGTPGGDTWRDHSIGVATRTFLDASNNPAGTWSYHADLTDPSLYFQPPQTWTPVAQGLVVTVTDPLQQTTAYYYDVDHFGTLVDQSCYPGGAEDIEYALPFTRMAGTAASDGLFLSSEVYDGLCTMQIPAFEAGCARTCLDNNNNPVLPIRTTYLLYDDDGSPGSGTGDQNGRVKKSRTLFNNDTGCGGSCYEETDFDDFDGLGHYRSGTQQSNFPGTSPRVTTTHYNARGGTYVHGANPDTYMILPTSPWLPGVYDYQTVAESSQTSRSEFCFNATTAFLERRRTMRSSDRTRDFLVTFDQTNGNVTAESYFGGDSQPLSSGFTTCTSSPPTPAYRLTHHYTAGSVDSTQYDGVGFQSLNLTIDANTGLASASTDTSGLITTNYVYDTMQRLTEVHPPNDAWTKYTYTFGTPTSLSILRRPFGSSSSAAPETSSYLYFDSFGRSVLSKDQFPENWSTTKTVYDALGRVVSASMREFRGNSSWEDFTPAHVTSTTYDRFNRPLVITSADSQSTTFTYTGGRVTNRTECLAANQTGGPCQSGEFPFTTTETVDGHGRLYTVTEPLGVAVTTTYAYDVGNRLATVTTSAPEGQQQRVFTYDLAGLLTSEQHPEKGVNGNGTVSYPEYDARGHVRHRIDGAAGGPFDTKFVYDAAERLTNVQDLDQSSNRRDLKVFTYATDNQTGNPRLGKLQNASRHNYLASLGGDTTVAETYTYGGPNGRVSARDTAVTGAFSTNTFSLGQTWDDLGDVKSITYPSNAALPSTPARTVDNSYANGVLTGVSGYTTNVTHLANRTVSHVTHFNGQNDDWTPDPNGMLRPESINITGTDGSDKQIGPYAYDAIGNIKQIGETAGTHTTYQYDGAGRLTRSDTVTPPFLNFSQNWSYDSFGNKLGVQTHQFDPNNDGRISSSDIFYLVNYLFLGGPAPEGPGGLLSGDANGDATVNSADLFYIVNYLFLGGPVPDIPVEALPSGDDMPVSASLADSVTVGTVTASGNTVDVPVYIRDLSGTPLGRDQAAGSKIQSFSIKVAYSPASAVSSVSFTRSGIDATLSPAAEFNPSSISSVSLVDTFQESTNLIPFTSNIALPGDLVGHLVFTLSSSAAPGSTITLSLDPSVTLLANAGGTVSETPADGTLALVDGAINIPVNMQTLPPSVITAEGTVRSGETQNGSISNASIGTAVPGNMPSSSRQMRLKRVNRPAGNFRPSPMALSYGTTNHDSTLTYDTAGDVILDSLSRSFTYDALSMTTGATVPVSGGGTRTFAYLYTADDERIALVEELSSGGTTTRWTLRGLDNHLLRTWVDSSSNGWSWSEDEIFRAGSLLAYESATGVRHVGLDHLGSTVVLTDPTGHLLGNVSYDAWGSGGATGAGMLQYTGQERDSTSVGLASGTSLPDYFHARGYDPLASRFLSVDSHIGAPERPQSWNRYTYASNNPLTRVDPDGRKDTMFIVNTLNTVDFTRDDVEALRRAVVGTRFEGNIRVIGPQASSSDVLGYVQRGDSTDIVAIISHAGPNDADNNPIGSIVSGRDEDFTEKSLRNGQQPPNLAISGSMIAAAANDGSTPVLMFAGCTSLMCAASATRATGVVAFGTTNLATGPEDGQAVVATLGALAQGVTPFAAALLGSKAYGWKPTPADCAGLVPGYCTAGVAAMVQSTQPPP